MSGNRQLGLHWGIKGSFMDYIAAISDSQALATDGATPTAGNVLVFEPAPPPPPEPEDADLMLAFRGGVRFSAMTWRAAGWAPRRRAGTVAGHSDPTARSRHDRPEAHPPADHAAFADVRPPPPPTPPGDRPRELGPRRPTSLSAA